MEQRCQYIEKNVEESVKNKLKSLWQQYRFRFQVQVFPFRSFPEKFL